MEKAGAFEGRRSSVVLGWRSAQPEGFGRPMASQGKGSQMWKTPLAHRETEGHLGLQHQLFHFPLPRCVALVKLEAESRGFARKKRKGIYEGNGIEDAYSNHLWWSFWMFFLRLGSGLTFTCRLVGNKSSITMWANFL